MNLTEIRSDIRLELSDAATFWSNDEIDRAVRKSVSLMSRFIPKRVITETTITRVITGETLTIASDAGTLSYKPVKVGSLSIPNKTLDTDYTINYMTGVVTEKNSGLDDTDYTVKYDLDPLMLDISSLLPEEDYIRIEKVESPVGDDPPTYITFEIFGEILLIKGKAVALTKDKHLRIIYLKPWTAPTPSTAASLTTSLDGDNNDLVFTARTGGVIGNSITITYDNPGGTGTISVAVTVTDIVVTLARTAGTITSTAADVKAAIDAESDAVTLVSVADANGNDGTGLVTAMAEASLTSGSDTGVDGDYPEHLDNAVIIGSCGQALIFKAEKYVQSAIDALSSLTAPSDYSFSAPSTPSAPTLSFADFIKAYKKMSDLVDGSEAGMLVDAVTYLTTGEPKIILINDAARVAEKYAQYAQVKLAVVAGYRELARAIYDEQMSALTKYNAQISAFKGEIEVEAGAVSNFTAKVQKYAAQTAEQAMKAENLLNIASRYLASGQSKINEFLIMLGIKPEFNKSKSSSEQFS